VQSYTRHQLKQDKFASATKEAVHWSVEHRKSLTIAIVLTAIAIFAYVGWSFYIGERDRKASNQFAQAMRTYSAQVQPANQPVNPDVKTFPSVKARSKAAGDEFLKVANDYPLTKNGKYARYMAGVSAMQGGDIANAETLLKESSGYSKDIATLSKYALASLYLSQNKENDAVRMYREVIAADDASVPKVVAQMELAELYTPKQPTEAAKVYEEIIKQEQEIRKSAAGKGAVAPGQEAARTPIEELATRKMEALKKK
jgi:predicted negative regulator of RcsB-dependent stress response